MTTQEQLVVEVERPTTQELLDEALSLLRDALDIFHGEHELCDEVGSREWVWRWCVLCLLDAQQEPTP